MAKSAADVEAAADDQVLASRLGDWTALSTTVVGVATLAVAITTPARSGPYCRSACISYPYTDVAAFVPRDYLWMYPAALLAVLFVTLTACFHQQASPTSTVAARIALSLAVIAAAAIVIDYGVQLTVLQPSLLKGETEGLSPFSQYNPHGVFIALENVGYLATGVAFLFASAVFAGGSRLERGIRWLFLGGGTLTLAAAVLLSVRYGADLDSRFEVASLSIDWVVLIVGGILLSIFFRRSHP
jgi:hypothetical protein